MDRSALRAIICGANEIQKECKKHEHCTTCFFYTDRYRFTACQLQAYMLTDTSNIGKLLSLQYLK